MATVTRKGQIILPKAARDSLGLEPGSQADFEIRVGAIVLRQRAPDNALERGCGFLRGDRKTIRTDDVINALRGR